MKRAKILDMKRRIMPADEVRTRDERETCVPGFNAAGERHGK